MFAFSCCCTELTEQTIEGQLKQAILPNELSICCPVVTADDGRSDGWTDGRMFHAWLDGWFGLFVDRLTILEN